MRISSVRHGIAQFVAAMRDILPRESVIYFEREEAPADGFVQRRREKSKDAAGSGSGSGHIRRVVPTLILAVAGITLSIVAWFVVAGWEDAAAEQQFQARASNSAATLQGGLDEYVNKIAALRAVFVSFPNRVSRKEFNAFATELLKGQDAIRSMSWIPRITLEERAAHESAAAKDGFSDYHIRTLTENGLIVAPEKAEYFPVYYRASERVQSMFGLDLGDGGARQVVLERARDTDRPAASRITMLQRGVGDQRGFFVLLPVYRQGAPHATLEERRTNLVGFVEGVFQTSLMVDRILGSIRSRVELYAVTPEGDSIPLHVRDIRAPQTNPSETASEGYSYDKLKWLGMLNVADTHWTIMARPVSNDSLASHTTSWFVFLSGLMLTAATTAYLWSSVRHGLGLVRANERISELAWTDPLTALANRRAFADRLNLSFDATGRNGAAFAVLYVDLDHFKDVNDTLGHTVGDTLLKQVAERLERLIRKTDLAARFGGDEFAILLSDAEDVSVAQTLADRIVEMLGAPYTIEGNQVRISASVGLSYYTADITKADSMMIQADLALFRAKEDGRNCARFHTIDLDRMVRERVTIADDLHLALERNELELHYQPQVDLASGKIIGLEALVRWNHPKRGLVSSSAFITIAERSGLIVPLGKWVFEEACRQITLWNDEGIAPQVVAVNVSAVECKRTQIVREMGACLAKWKIKPYQMEVELTESVLMEATQNNGDVVDGLRKLGLRIAIDDFGTGYSSLSYLTHYPVDRLKIAQELVIGVTGDERNASVVKVAIRLGNELGIEVIAEGVETDAQVRFLAGAGCTRAQGFYFSKPVNAKRATELLRQGFFELTTDKSSRYPRLKLHIS